MKKLLIITLIFILILSGCQGRKVNRVISLSDFSNSKENTDTTKSDGTQLEDNVPNSTGSDIPKTTSGISPSDIETINSTAASNESNINENTEASSNESYISSDSTEELVNSADYSQDNIPDLESTQAESNLTSDTSNDSTEILDSNVSSETINNNQVTQSSEDIIVAESENLDTENERTAILNEIDALLDSTLNNLEQLDQDQLLDENIVKEGGLE